MAKTLDLLMMFTDLLIQQQMEEHLVVVGGAGMHITVHCRHKITEPMGWYCYQLICKVSHHIKAVSEFSPLITVKYGIKPNVGESA